LIDSSAETKAYIDGAWMAAMVMLLVRSLIIIATEPPRLRSPTGAPDQPASPRVSRSVSNPKSVITYFDE
jgi:hypothetical protein